MKIAYSPCPNDTFVFHALVHGLVPGAPKFEVTYADIDITNHLAASSAELDILKISYAALPWALPEYRLISAAARWAEAADRLYSGPERTALP